MVRITFLGTDAKTNKDNHFCLLIQHKRCKVLLDPSVSKIKNIDYDVVIISDIDADHYYRINLVPENIPIYSTAGVINYLSQLDKFKNRNLNIVERDTKLCNRMKVEFFKTNKEVGHPSCGIKIEDVVIYPEVAPYIPQYNLKLLHKSHLIAGVGNYEKTDKKKISFLDFIKILEENEEGYKPKQLYITNLREDLKRHKREVNEILKEYKGKVIDSNIVLQYKREDFWTRHKPKWRAYTIEDIFSLKEFIPNQDNKIVLDQKFDGKYVQVLREDKNNFKIMVDPEELKEKKNYIINKRMQFQIEDLKKSPITQFRCDAELVAFKKESNEILHRTVTNALANLKTKIDDKLASSYLRLYIYDVTQFNNKDVRSLPLKERYELLRNIANNINSIYVKFDIPITNLKKDSLSYIVNNKEDFKTIFYKIYNEEIKSLPKYISEGVMIKRLNGIYEYPQDSNLMKLKRWKEIDVRIIGKRLVKGAKKTWNYDLGLDITKEYYEKLPNKNRVQLNNKYYMYYGKSDNTNINGEIGDILRVASEEVIKYENKDYPDFPYFKGYINRAMELVPEKNITDTLEVALRLSQLEPRRIPIEEIQRWKIQVPEVIKTKEKDWGWVQFHIRGITKEEYEDKNKELWEKFIDHSLHADIRLDIKKAPKTMQFVLTESDFDSYIRVFKGETDPKTNNVQKGKIIIKPSAISKSLLEKTVKEEAVLDKKAAKEIVKYDLKEHSFWIKPGEVGATPYSYSYMMTIWLGNVISGVQREDLHEFLLKPYKDIPKINQELINGRYIFRAFKTKPPTWWMFKAINSEELMDPKEHCDQQYYKLHKAEDIKLFGREAYKKAGKC